MKKDDLISRATLLNDLSYCAPELWQDEEYIKAKIMKQPAVDAVPVVHGMWTEEETSENTIDEWQSAKCTNCGKYHTTPYLYYFNSYKFCPNCGARMDGERRDDDALSGR